MTAKRIRSLRVPHKSRAYFSGFFSALLLGGQQSLRRSVKSSVSIDATVNVKYAIGQGKYMTSPDTSSIPKRNAYPVQRMKAASFPKLTKIAWDSADGI